MRIRIEGGILLRENRGNALRDIWDEFRDQRDDLENLVDTYRNTNEASFSRFFDVIRARVFYYRIFREARQLSRK